MSFRMTCLFLYLVLNSIILSNSQEEEDVIVMPILDKNLNHYCSDNVYHFQFEVKFSKELDKVIPFEMTIPLPNRLSFKCIINGPKSNIDCFHSFSNYVWSLPDNSRIELPYSFPNIEGIRWDYDLFLRKIYRYLWRTIGNCGLEYELNPSMNSMNINNQQTQQTPNNPKKAEIVADVEEISGGKCYSSQNDFSFKMKLKLYEGEIFEELKKVKAENKATSIKYLIGLKKATQGILKKNRQNVLKKLLNNDKEKKWNEKMKNIIDFMDKNNQNNSLHYYLKKWKKANRTMKKKETTLEEKMKNTI